MLGSSLKVTMMSLLISLVSFANQLVIAWQFGASGQFDSYLLASSMPILVSGVMTAVLSYSMVPSLIAHKNTPIGYRLYAGSMTQGLIVVAILVSVVGYLISPDYISIINESLNEAGNQNVILIARVSWITAGLVILSGHFLAMHNAAKRFFFPLLMNVFPYIGMIVFTLVWGQSYGSLSIALGLLVGNIITCSCLALPLLSEMSFVSGVNASWKNIAGYFSQAPLVILAMLCFSSYQFVDAIWAHQLGPGNLSCLGYSQRILVALGTLIISGPSLVLVPRFAEAYNEGRRTDFLDDLGRSVRIVLTVSAPIALAFSVFSAPIIRLLFQRGAFDEIATQRLASILPYMMFGMVAMLCVVIMYRAFFAMRNNASAALVSVSTVFVYFIFSYGLIGKYSIKGIGLAYIVSWYFNMFMSILSLWKADYDLLLSNLHIKFAIQLICSILLTYLVARAMQILIIVNYAQSLFLLSILLVLSLFVVFLVYFIITVFVFKMPDIKFITSWVYDKISLFYVSRKTVFDYIHKT